MKRINKDWNILDSLFFFTEDRLGKLIGFMKENRAQADPEQMIEAAISHLKSENEELKEFRIPEKVLYKKGQYFCPKCNYEINGELIERFQIRSCPDCGKVLKKYTYKK